MNINAHAQLPAIFKFDSPADGVDFLIWWEQTCNTTDEHSDTAYRDRAPVAIFKSERGSTQISFSI